MRKPALCRPPACYFISAQLSIPHRESLLLNSFNSLILPTGICIQVPAIASFQPQAAQHRAIQASLWLMHVIGSSWAQLQPSFPQFPQSERILL